MVISNSIESNIHPLQILMKRLLCARQCSRSKVSGTGQKRQISTLAEHTFWEEETGNKKVVKYRACQMMITGEN